MRIERTYDAGYSSESKNKELQNLYKQAQNMVKEVHNVSKPDDVAELFFGLHTAGAESFCAAYLDTKNNVIKTTKTEGTVGAASAYPRNIAKDALLCDAAAVVLCHNHPGGSSELSEADKNITKDIYKALALFKIDLLDHVILFKTGNSSLRESPFWSTM